MTLPLLTTFILLTLLTPTPTPTHAKKPHSRDQFFTDCPPSTCGSGSGSIQIRFPFRLQSTSTSCGLPGLNLDLTCSSTNTTLLSLPSSSSPPLKVTRIDYKNSLLTVHIESGYGSCPLQNSSFISSITTSTYSPVTISTSSINCSKKIGPDRSSDAVAGPISCLNESGYYMYAVAEFETMDVVPRGCMVFKTGVEVPIVINDYNYDIYEGEYDLGKALDFFEKRREIDLRWDVGEKSKVCEGCEEYCGFDREKNQSFCQVPSHQGLQVKLITGTSVSGFVILVTVSLILFYISRHSEKERTTRIKVEKFLATYKKSKPTRYTYSGIRKITKRFKHKLGQGGFGSVYVGELLNGIPVAVKMLEKSKGEGQDFINEVATMGRIHHVNVVQLLGFCSEGTRHALVYEYMPNESLEKFIFSKMEKRRGQHFSMEKLLDIAIGIARGIEYLHQGCDQRILHFDIKPHNILLDHDFNPKISDFGLAKLCSRDHSIVTMTAVRGTMGYIAPEIYSRNFGIVSYKSDVYSFGMLLLEMVSGRRNVDPGIENQSEAYFPEWVYDRLVHGEDLGLVGDEGNEGDIVKKLVIVALWCIQWSPTDRPTMTRVVQLLMGNLESLQIPRKPFVSSSDQDDGTSVEVLVESANSSQHTVV